MALSSSSSLLPSASFPSSSPFMPTKSYMPTDLISFSRTETQCSNVIIRGRRIRRRRSNLTISADGGKKFQGTAMREEKLSEMIETKVAEATEVCDGDDGKGSDGCKVAWDEVEEVSQAKADLTRKLQENADPLQFFCDQNPDTDECIVYDD